MKASPSTPGRSLPDKRLSLYKVAAGAALAAGASTAEANLVTLDLSSVSPANRSTGEIGSLWFDVNATTAAAAVSTTGTFAGADFRIFTGNFGGPSGYFASISGLTPNNEIAGFRVEGFKATTFSSSNFVGPTTESFGNHATIASKFGGLNPGESGYLGLKFEIGSDIHYGWANITLGTVDYPSVTLNALGYETNPDTAAHVEGATGSSVPDQGSTLALLAIGAAGLTAFRGLQRKTV